MVIVLWKSVVAENNSRNSLRAISASPIYLAKEAIDLDNDALRAAVAANLQTTGGELTTIVHKSHSSSLQAST